MILKWLKELFNSVDCHCVCHDKGKDIVHKGGYIVASCKHCFREARIEKSIIWGNSNS